MGPSSRRVVGTNNDIVLDVNKVLRIEGHTRTETPQQVDPSHLDIPLVDVHPGNLVQLRLRGKEMSGHVQ